MYSRITLILFVPFRSFINIPYLCGGGLLYLCLGIVISCGMRYSEDTTLIYQLVGPAPTSVRA